MPSKSVLIRHLQETQQTGRTFWYVPVYSRKSCRQIDAYASVKVGDKLIPAVTTSAFADIGFRRSHLAPMSFPSKPTLPVPVDTSNHS